MDQARWDRLIKDLKSVREDLDRAVEASMTLMKLTDKTRIPELERLIQDDEFFVREAVAWPLSNLKGLNALPLLLKALERGEQEGHDNDELQCAITDMIWSHQSEAAPVLLRMFKSRRGQTRSHAAWLLGYVSEFIPSRLLIKALNDPDPDVRSAALGTLSSFKGQSGVFEAVLSFLNDPEEKVRVSAASSLGFIGDPHAIPALKQALNDPSQTVRRIADFSLAMLEGRRK